MSFQDDIVAKRAQDKADALLVKQELDAAAERARANLVAQWKVWNETPADRMKIRSTTTTTSYKYCDDRTSYEYTATINGETFDIKDWEYDKLKAEGCPFIESSHYEPIQD